MTDPLRLDFDELTLERVLNFLPYPFLISKGHHDEQRNIYLNKKFQEEIGFTLEEIPTINDWFMKAYPESEYQKEVIRKWNKKFARALRMGKDSVMMNARIHTKQNGNLWYQVKASITGPIQLVVFININDEVVREKELEQQNENKNQALSVLTHDLRTPLNNLMSIIQLSGQGSITAEEYAKNINEMSSNIFKLIEFFDTTLQWTRSNFAKVNTSFALIDLEKIITQIVQIYQSQYVDKKLNISIDVSEAMNVWTDPEIVSIVTRNIISNAIKFTKDNGSIKITAWKNGHRTFIAFKDSGKGMSKERIEMIVNRKYSSEQGTAGEKGLGMGLQLSNQLLFKIGGRLEIESAPDEGTLMRIVL